MPSNPAWIIFYNYLLMKTTFKISNGHSNYLPFSFLRLLIYILWKCMSPMELSGVFLCVFQNFLRCFAPLILFMILKNILYKYSSNFKFFIWGDSLCLTILINSKRFSYKFLTNLWWSRFYVFLSIIVKLTMYRISLNYSQIKREQVKAQFNS